MNVYREAKASLGSPPRVFEFKQRGSLLVVLTGLLLTAFFLGPFIERAHVHCSRRLNICTFSSIGLGSASGHVRLSDVQDLIVERGSSHLTRVGFTMANGHVTPLTESWSNTAENEKSALAAKFGAFHLSTNTTDEFDAAYGPPLEILVFGVLALASAFAFVRYGGAYARVVVGENAETTVTHRANAWSFAKTVAMSRAHVRPWRGAPEIYDDAGQVVTLPAGLRDSRALALAAWLERDPAS